MATNQCDGCNRNLKLLHGIHYDGKHPVQSCQSGRYEDTKMHMITVGGKTVFVTMPAGDRPKINEEDLFTVFGVQPGQCVKIG